MPYFDIFCCHIDPRTWSHILAKIFPFKGPQAMELGKTPGPRATSKAKLLLLGGPGATARPKLSISLGPRATTPSQIIVVLGTWSRSPAKIFNLLGTWSLNPKPNYCCTGDLEPQPGPNFQSKLDLEPQPQAKLLLNGGPGAAARTKFSISLGSPVRSSSQIIVVWRTWRHSLYNEYI